MKLTPAQTVMVTQIHADGYSVNMRQDKRNGEHLAFMPATCPNRHGDRYYMAYTLAGGWVEIDPGYAVKCTRTATDFPAELKRATEVSLGYSLRLTHRLRG